MARARHRRRATGCLSRLICLVLLFFIIGYPFYEAQNWQTETATLEVNGLSSDLNNLKIAYISDIHYGSFLPQSKVEELVNRVNALNPDIILLGGDYAEDSDGAIRFFQIAPRFRARLLTAGVMGNHDRTVPEGNLALLQSAMLNAGVLPLVNAVKEVRIGSAALYLAGIDDVNNGHPDVNAVAQQLRQDDFCIFLTHSPEGLADAFNATGQDGKSRWFDLALCGHTHGGQVTLFGQPLIPSIAKVESRYQSGWLTENRIPVLVSNGVGTSVLPIRLFAQPQIHLITLKAVK
ncbi:MAG: metallophosphoesterase [Clostridia bacterium]|nr:metallophosphoesterase [Clostridia bacterium]